jgi:hypothetical protein
MPLPRRPRSLPAALALVAALAGACDFLENPDEVQNSSNNAFVEAQVFVARDNRTPVPGVLMIVESDPDSEQPFVGPDQSFVTDAGGFVRAEVFPGRDLEQQPEAGPATPFDVAPPLFFGDACVSFVHEGSFFSFSCGVTIGAGRVLNLGLVFLSDFGALPAEDAE